MGGDRLLLIRSHLLLLLLLVWRSSGLPFLRAQSSGSSTTTPAPASTIAARRALDSILQDYAYRSLDRPDLRTGVVYDGTVPSNLTGIKVSGIRLRSGSLYTRGDASYKEFEIPVRVIEQPYVERLVLVYQNLGNWSDVYYPMMPGYTYLSPVLGLLAYTAGNLSATNLPELDYRATANPILVHFSGVGSLPDGLVAQCVAFDSNGSMNLSSLVSSSSSRGSTCATTGPGHFGLVINGTLPSPPATPTKRRRKEEKKGHDNKVWIIVGSVVGGVLLLLLLVLLWFWLKKCKRRKKMQRMEKSSEVGETLRMAPIGSAKAPAAVVTRTQPTLETEYVP